MEMDCSYCSPQLIPPVELCESQAGSVSSRSGEGRTAGLLSPVSPSEVRTNWSLQGQPHQPEGRGGPWPGQGRELLQTSRDSSFCPHKGFLLREIELVLLEAVSAFPLPTTVRKQTSDSESSLWNLPRSKSWPRHYYLCDCASYVTPLCPAFLFHTMGRITAPVSWNGQECYKRWYMDSTQVRHMLGG